MRALTACLAALLLALPMAAAAQSVAGVERQIADARASMMVDPDATQKKAVEAAQSAALIGDPRQRRILIATTQWLRSEAYSRLGAFSRAEPLINDAANVVLRDDPDSMLAGEILLTRGGLRNARTEVAGSLADYQRAFEIFQHNGNARSQAIALMLIASLCSDGKDYERALRYLTQASDIYKGDPSLMVALYNNRGGVLQDLQRPDDAEKQFTVALSYAEKMDSPVLVAQVLRNIARNRLKAGRVALAEQAVRRSLTVAATGEAASWRPQLLALAAEAALQRGNLDQATTLIEQSFAGVDLKTTEYSWLEPHKTAYRVFSRLGRYDLAIAHLAALKRIDDQATSLATSTSNALMAARFDFANQELRIAKLKAGELQRSVALEQARARVQQIVFMAVAGATAVIIVLLAIGLFTIRRSRNEVRDARDGLALTNAALNKALAAKTEFLATTSHEIRTPLNGILGMTQVMLADAYLPATTRDRLGVVQDAGLTMRALVDDILDVAKMETGELSIDHESVDLVTTITGATRLWEDQARHKGLDFVVDLSDCPQRVLGDAARLRQIVFNLLSNAVKFTATGRVSLSVTTSDDRSQFIIRVADTGIGIATEKQAAIFESFRQADTSTTRQYGGTGLGLTICRNLVLAMHGDIAVESRPGAGAAFTVTLPLESVIDAEPSVEAVVMPAALLVLDRNPITRSMWKTLLERRAGRLLFVATVDDARTALREERIARVLIDEATLCADAEPAAAAAALVEAAQAAGAETSLLWTEGREGGVALAKGMTRLIAKPISGAALAATLFGHECDERAASRLVSQAA
ncbi:ATP-binding protein [Sphingomonas sp. KR1UV-12]|uniref:histidine kinase n=1 Tax=Sphingomonas aurea TaxID=3063994 RepID=A0ABT9EG02_9SPHN|nr:ATP-binding protein [Sphingomonas sp. KR1UV-12]MDP1025901.1 ATP-binding protein [Sphingomonas sp. KR1UV-12]